MKNKQQRLVAYKQTLQYYKDCEAKDVRPIIGICCIMGLEDIYQFDKDFSCQTSITEIWEKRVKTGVRSGDFWFNSDQERVQALEEVIKEMEEDYRLRLGAYKQILGIMEAIEKYGQPFRWIEGICEVLGNHYIDMGLTIEDRDKVKDNMYMDIWPLATSSEGGYWFNGREERLEVLRTVIVKLENEV